MLTSKKYQNKRIAIYGMGITGCASAKIFKKLKANVFCWDDNKKIREKIKKNNLPIKKFWSNKSDMMDVIVVSPGINIKKCNIKRYLKKNKNKIITDIDLFFEFNKKARVISITGTNGKSTTCKILEKILKTAKYNTKTVGNIGNPILTLNKPKKDFIFILEASSYQLEYSKLFNSKHAAILNISPDHLDRHKNITNYIKIKCKIFLGQKYTDYSYINIKNKYSKIIKKIFKKEKIKSKLILINKSNYSFLLKKINNKYLKSTSNIENLSFAYKIAKNLKISDKIIIKALNKFKGLPHRQEQVFLNKKILCINDSKATSFDACLQSLKNYRNIYWIVGGLPKNKDQFYLNKVKNNIFKAYIIGKSTSFFKKKISNVIPHTVSKNIENALEKIKKDIKLNNTLKNTILFSPAAASYDQYKNFETRGNYFKSLVVKKFNQRLNV